jgi:hypothetical protein
VRCAATARPTSCHPDQQFDGYDRIVHAAFHFFEAVTPGGCRPKALSGVATTARSSRGARKPSGATFPRPKIHTLEARHFALDERLDEIAALVLMLPNKHLD